MLLFGEAENKTPRFNPKIHTGGGYHILSRMIDLEDPFHPYVMGDEEIPEAQALDYRYRIHLASFINNNGSGLLPSYVFVTVVDLLTDHEYHRGLGTDRFDKPVALDNLAVACQRVDKERWVMAMEVPHLLRALYEQHGLALPVSLLASYRDQTHNDHIELQKAGPDHPGCYIAELPMVSDAAEYGIYVERIQFVITPLGFYDGDFIGKQPFYCAEPSK